jgi:hypothetical protein
MKQSFVVTFYTRLEQVFATGVYKTLKAAYKARERYELQYGACLKMTVAANLGA